MPTALTLVILASAAAAQPAQPICAIDMGSNSFRRIVGSFENGRYDQRRMDVVTMGVGDDLARHQRISDAKLKEIEQQLTAFKRACEKEGATPVKAVGTAAFRDAPNGMRVVDLARTLGIAMEIATERRESELAYLVGALGRDGYAVVDNGSRSIELVTRERGATRYVVFNLGYRVAYDTFFARASNVAQATLEFRARLMKEAARAPFMKGQRGLVAVEFGEMAEVFFPSSDRGSRMFTLGQLQQKLREVTGQSTERFKAMKATKDIDRALPRLVVAVFLMEQFGYSQLELTDRELGAGLVIEAGTKRE
jgi:exopolyphosphatase/pppGpp-phosphohydrolase